MISASTTINAHAQHFEASDEFVLPTHTEIIPKIHSLTPLHELLDVFTLCVASELPVAPTSTIVMFCSIVSTLAPNQTSKPLRGVHLLVFNLYCCQRLSTFLASCLLILSNYFLFILLNLFPHYFMCRSIQMAYLILYQFTPDTVLIIFCNYLLLTLVGNVSVTLTKRLVFVVLLSLCALSIVPVSTAQSILPCILARNILCA